MDAVRSKYASRLQLDRRDLSKQELWNEIKDIKRIADASNGLLVIVSTCSYRNAGVDAMKEQLRGFYRAMSDALGDEVSPFVPVRNGDAQADDEQQADEGAQPADGDASAEAAAPAPRPRQQTVTAAVAQRFIPQGVDPAWVGYDISRSYVIKANGNVMYDVRKAFSSRITAADKNANYHGHLRYIRTRWNKLCESSVPLGVAMIVNNDRIGMPGTVASTFISPLLYDRKYADLLAMFKSFCMLLSSEVQRREALQSNVSIYDDAFVRFAVQLHGDLVAGGTQQLVDVYERGLGNLYQTEDVAALMQDLRRRVAPAVEHEEEEQKSAEDQAQ